MRDRGEVDTDPLQQLLRFDAAALPVDERPPRELRAEEQIGRDVARVHEREILVDRRDPRLDRVFGAGQRQRFAVEEDLAFVGSVETRDDLDQRRLAGAVVAEQGERLPGAHLEAHVTKSLNVPEGLADAASLKQWLGALLGRHVHLDFLFRATELNSTASTNTAPVTMYCT